MSSTQQHIVLKVDDKVVYDSSSPATTTPAPAAALTRPAEDIDVKKLKVVEKPISKTEYYVVTYDVKIIYPKGIPCQSVWLCVDEGAKWLRSLKALCVLCFPLSLISYRKSEVSDQRSRCSVRGKYAERC